MHVDFVGKVIVITGSSRGLGKELALEFARNGASVVINYRENQKAALETLSELKKYNQNCVAVCADVSREEDVREMFFQVKKLYGRIDVLINNAGINADDYVNLMNNKKWSSVIDTNLTGVFLCTRYFSKNMIKYRSGKIINIASLKGQLGSEGQANYAASKAGVIGFSRSVAKELGKVGISVNVICPGYIKTELNSENLYKFQIANQMSAMGIEHSMRDYVNFTVLLASDLIKGVSGQVFNIDSRIM